jgi:hypothetical protein
MSALRLLALTGLAFAFVSCGCGRKTSYSTSEGEVTVETKGGEVEITAETEQGRLRAKGDESSVTVTSEEGTARFGAGQEIDPREIGILVYPGAEVAASMRWTDSEAPEGDLTQVHLTTPDSFAEVEAFYQKELPEAEVSAQISTAEIKMLQLQWEEDGLRKAVVVTRDAADEQTRIILQKNLADE